MELRQTPRLYIETLLAPNQTITLDSQQSHYLQHVLRLKPNDILRLFNARDGEWKVSIATLSKKSVTLALHEQTRAPQPDPDLWLCAAPIKKAHFDYMIEKATELGIAVLQPILTARTQIREINLDRCRAIAIEAAEQSERLTIPEIRKPITLTELTTQTRTMIVCAEWGEATPIGAALQKIPNTPTAIVTGPEGGFAAEELEKLRNMPNAHFVRLGLRILRADTAAIAALTCWQSQCGDWRKP